MSLVYGSTEVDNLQTNNRLNDRFAAALDAVVDPDTGEIVCRSNLDPSAVPFNLAWNGWDGFEPLPGHLGGLVHPRPRQRLRAGEHPRHECGLAGSQRTGS